MASDLAPVRLSDRTIALDTREVFWDGGSCRLTPTEASMVGYLAARTTEFISQDQLLLDVWGYDPRVRTRTVVSTVHRLRAKLEPDPKNPRHLIRNNIGYRLVVNPESGPSGAQLALPPWSPRGTVVLWGIGGASMPRLVVQLASPEDAVELLSRLAGDQDPGIGR